MPAVTPGVVMPCVPRAPVTNTMCLLAMPMCLPVNHIQLLQSDKHAHTAITSNQGDDEQDKLPEEITFPDLLINVLAGEP